MAEPQAPKEPKPRTGLIITWVLGCGCLLTIGIIVVLIVVAIVVPAVVGEQQAYQENLRENDASQYDDSSPYSAPDTSAYDFGGSPTVTSTTSVTPEGERKAIVEQAKVLRTAAFVYGDKYGTPYGFEDYVGIQPSASLPEHKNVSLYDFGTLPGGCAVTQAAIDCDDATFHYWNGLTYYYTDLTICVSAVSTQTGEKLSECK